MLFTRTLFLSLLISALVNTTTVLGQLRSTKGSAEAYTVLQNQALFKKVSHSIATLATDGESDSLLAKRTFFWTIITEHGRRLPPRSVMGAMEDTPHAQIIYLRSQILKPVGPLLITSGLIVGYLGVKGTKKTDYARGIGTAANPSPPDVLVEYTSRSLPMLAGGIGLVIGGLCLVEISNELTAKSVDLYNARVIPGQSVSGVQKARLGITASGNLGIEATF